MSLNAILVPTHMTRATSIALRGLSSAVGRKDLRPMVADARRIADSFDRLEKTQEFPRGSNIIGKFELPSVPPRAWRSSDRKADMEKILAEQGSDRIHEARAERLGES